MVYHIVKKLIMYFPNKVIVINKNIDKIITFPEKADKTFTYVSKLTGASTGAAGAARGVVDLAEALVCQDGICALVSGAVVAADCLQIFASFIPGPNVTSIVTMPISVGCKVFVWCCKKSKLPWGTC